MYIYFFDVLFDLKIESHTDSYLKMGFLFNLNVIFFFFLKYLHSNILYGAPQYCTIKTVAFFLHPSRRILLCTIIRKIAKIFMCRKYCVQ